MSRLVSTERLNEMKREMPLAGRAIHRLLGCEFGRAISRPGDELPCEEAAVQIVVLHDGPRAAEFKLCARHRDLVLSESTPSVRV
jgi:hypothetical protein